MTRPAKKRHRGITPRREIYALEKFLSSVSDEDKIPLPAFVLKGLVSDAKELGETRLPMSNIKAGALLALWTILCGMALIYWLPPPSQ